MTGKGTKFCRDCVFAASASYWANCYSPDTRREDPSETYSDYAITGKVKMVVGKCRVERCTTGNPGYCGPEARFFRSIYDDPRFRWYWCLAKMVRVLFTVYLHERNVS